MSENKDPFGTSSPEDDHVAKIFENAEDDALVDNSDEILFGDEKKGKKKRALILSSGVALAIATGAALLFWTPVGDSLNFAGNHEQREGQALTPGENPDDTEHIPDEDEYDGPNESFAFETGNEFPIETEDWQVVGRSFIEDEEALAEGLHNYADAIELSTDANVLPQEIAGFTSNEDEQTLDDGTLNPMYSYWTAEGFKVEVADILERLLNPTYGEWGLYQFGEYKPSTQFDMEIIEDIFTTTWLTENSSKDYGEYVPVYADWNENSYGLEDKLLVSGSRWIGNITNLTTDFEYDMETQQYVVDLTADVTFSAWTHEEEVLERNGQLTLELVSNANEANSSSNYKVLVNNASLTVDGV